MRAKDFIGRKRTLSGPVFSERKDLEKLEYDVLNAKDCIMTFMSKDLEETKYTAVKLLLKREGMKRAQWTRKILTGKL